MMLEWRNMIYILYEFLIIIFFVVECVIIGFIVLGNLLIIISLFWFYCFWKWIYILIGNLVVFDFLIGIVFILYDFVFLFNLEFVWWKYFCLICYFLCNMFFGVFVMNLLVILFEWYIVVLYFFKYVMICIW